MAKQKGIIKLIGKVDDFAFYKSQDGFLARGKGGVDASRIANDPAFQRTRENGAEFGTAGKAGKILRSAIRALVQNAADNRMVGRLTREMVKVVKADITNPRGQRNVIDGEAELLEGFDFNIRGKLGTTVFATYNAKINRDTGAMTVSISSFVPVNMIAAPSGATHYKISMACAEVDFQNEKFVVDVKETAQLPLDNVATGDIELAGVVPANSTHPLFIALGIEFYQDVNGVKYPMKNGTYNSLALVKVNGV